MVAMPTPPVAPQIPHTHEAHGDVREDPYFWMREKDSEPVLSHLAAENAYADELTAPLQGFRDKLYEEIKGRVPQDDEGVPQVGRDGWWYSWRIEDGDKYPTHFRTKGDEVQELIDLNALGEEHKFVGLTSYACAKGSNLLWYTIDFTGFHQCELHVRDVERQEEVEHAALSENPEFGRVAQFMLVEGRDDAMWLVVEDEQTKRGSRLYFWQVGDDKPTLVMHEEDERFNIGLHSSADFRYIVVSVSSHVTDEVWVADATSLEPELRLLFKRQQDVEIQADHYKDDWFILTNTADGEKKRNFELVRVPGEAPNSGPRKVLVPHREHVLIEGFDIFENHLTLYERAEGVTAIFVYDLVDGELSNRRQVTFPETMIECAPGANYVTDTHLLRVTYQSLTTPAVVYDCDMRTMEMTELKRQEVLGDYDPENYTSTRSYATAEDGTKIPLTITHHKGTNLDGTAACYLQGYGAYGLPYELYFAGHMLSLLDRGVVYVIAHIRGGSEMGKAWHDQGRMENKMNSFTDFIACAEHLLAERITSPRRLCAEGRSAGGLLMGGVLNMRPELFTVVYAGVPFVDVLTTMLDTSLPLTVGEFEEWGNPSIPEDYERMKAYSPYDNVEEKEYPAIMVRTSYNDAAVMYWEPAKWVARLRERKTDDNPLLFRCEMGAGHGGLTSRFDRYEEVAEDFAFLCSRVGINS